MAEIEEIDGDPERAREFLSQAKTFLEERAKGDLSLESTVVLYWNACISGMDAVLTHAGRRITSGTHSHALRVSERSTILGGGYADLFDRMDVWRRERGDVSYAAVQPSAASVAAMEQDARDLVAAVERFLR